jgi:hypothetical protein
MSAEFILPGTTINIAAVDNLKRGLFCSIWPNFLTPLPYKKNPVFDLAIGINGSQQSLKLPFEFVDMNHGETHALLRLGLLDAVDIVIKDGGNVLLNPRVREIMNNGVDQIRRGRSSWTIKANPFPFVVTEDSSHYFVEPYDLPPDVWYGKRKGNISVPSNTEPIARVSLNKNKPNQRKYMKLSSSEDGHFHYEFEYDPENGLRHALLGFIPIGH